MPEIRNKDQIVTVSEIGGTVTRWQYRGVDIFYPQQLVKRERKMKLRGGMHACFPNFGTVDPKFGLPKHGPLRNRNADEVWGDGVVFQGTDLLGPTHNEECRVKITVVLTQTGFTYLLSVRLIRPTPRAVFLNVGLHPYFQTPTGNAQAGAWGDRMHRFYRRKHGPQSSIAGQGADVVIPGIGKVQMLFAGAWRKLYYWRDSRKYLCVEPVFGDPGTYGSPGCVQLTDKWVSASCQFSVSLT